MEKNYWNIDGGEGWWLETGGPPKVGRWLETDEGTGLSWKSWAGNGGARNLNGGVGLGWEGMELADQETLEMIHETRTGKKQRTVQWS